MTQILTKEFTLAEVLGAISGYLLEHRGFGRIQELIEWVVGSPVFTHQIPYVADNVKKSLVKQFPQLDMDAHSHLAVDVSLLVSAIKEKNQVNEAAIWRRLKERYGSTFQIAPLQPFDEFEAPPLITDNIKDKVIIVETRSDGFPDTIDA